MRRRIAIVLFFWGLAIIDSASRPIRASTSDPRGNSKDVVAMHQAMQVEDYETAVKVAEALIGHGFVNIEAHAICAKAYEVLDNPQKAKFHHDIAAAFIQSILGTRDGKTKETAFEVIGTFEEHITVAVLGLPAFGGSQSLMPGKPHSWLLI